MSKYENGEFSTDLSDNRYHHHWCGEGDTCAERLQETGSRTKYHWIDRSRSEGEISTGVCTQVSTIHNIRRSRQTPFGVLKVNL